MQILNPTHSGPPGLLLRGLRTRFWVSDNAEPQQKTEPRFGWVRADLDSFDFDL